MSLFRLAQAFAMSFALVVPTSVSAAEPVPIELNDIRHRSAALEIAGPAGTASYSPAELEALGAMRMITKTPWREEEAAFDGVLLSELLDAHGLLDVEAIRVIAENDYAVTIPSAVWRDWPVLVATRVNGRAHSRRERGPIQFILPLSADANVGLQENVNYWVWMAARIEAAD